MKNIDQSQKGLWKIGESLNYINGVVLINFMKQSEYDSVMPNCCRVEWSMSWVLDVV